MTQSPRRDEVAAVPPPPPRRRPRRSLAASLAAIALACVFVVTTLMLVAPNHAWYLFPSWRSHLVKLVLWRFDGLARQSAGVVWTLLSEPDEKVPAYVAVRLSAAADGHTGYSFTPVGEAGKLRLIGPTAKPAGADAIPFTPETWQHADAGDRQRMLSDLVAGYQAGRWGGDLATIHEVAQRLGAQIVGEQWVYGLGERKLVVRFGLDGRVAAVDVVPAADPVKPLQHAELASNGDTR